MDLTTQLKESLISRIKESEDLNFLKALQMIIDSSEQSLYELSEEQQNNLEESRQQIDDGRFTPNSQVISEMRSWLLKK